jgi:hypothetical protein
MYWYVRYGGFDSQWRREKMSLEKSIKHGKEKRKPYYGKNAVHVFCPWCRSNRMHKHNRHEPIDADVESTLE